MICPKCQTTNPDSAKFCMNCATPLAAPPSADAGGRADFNLDRYLPRELVAKLAAARAHGGMSGERRIITILFCDVKGSTAAAEKLDPEEWTEVMNQAFEHMIRPIYKYEGIVPRLMGDAILAFFGAPIAHEDDPQRAALAALEIQSEMEPFSRQIEQEHGLAIKVRVGINTGLVVVGEIGSDLRLEYTAIGDAINLAARMEQTAEPGTIQVSAETHALIAPFFEFEPLGETQIKGKTEPVQTFRLLQAKGTPGQLRGVEGLSSPLVGREKELAQLNELLLALSAGEGAFILVTGEAGLGKTSLIAEARRQIRLAEPVRWLEGRALSYAHSISYFAWRQVIRQSVGAGETDSPSDVRRRLKEAGSHGGFAADDISFLEALLSVESEESLKVVSAYQGDEFIERMIEAAQRHLCTLARLSPLAIVLDDLHWMDEASLGLFEHLAGLVRENAILFFGMLRPDREAASSKFVEDIHQKLGENLHQLFLSPLPADQTGILLGNLLGVEELPHPVLRMILEKAEGNPFFIEEIIRSLIETKQIIRENEHWKLSGEISQLALPATLSGMLGARIDRLPEEAKHILQTAAVIGRSFDPELLTAIAHPAGEIQEPLSKLQEVGLIERSPGEEEEYIFRHVLIQDAAYNSVLLKQRRALHKLVGAILEERYAGRRGELAPLLAHHFYLAEDERSLQYDSLAGESAARLYAHAEAAIHFARALEVAQKIQAPAAQIAQLFTRLGSVFELSGHYEQAIKAYNQMESFARERKEPSMALNALMAKATIYSTPTALLNPQLSEQSLIQALELSRQAGDLPAQAKLYWNLMLNYLHSRRLEQAYESGQRALALARQGGDREQLAFVLNDIGRVYVSRGEFESAFSVIREARELWHQLDNRVMQADNLGAEEEGLYSLGRYDQQIKNGRQALEICESIDNLWGKSYHRLLMGLAYFEQGRPDLAIQLAGEAIGLGDQGGLIISTIPGRCDLAWIYGSCGAFDKALALVAEALKITEENLPAWKAMPLAMKVRLYSLQGDSRAAEEAASVAPLEPVSIPFPHYKIMVDLAEIELAQAQRDFARALARADRLLAEMTGIVRGEIPKLMNRKGDALLALGRAEEAHQILTAGRALAEELGASQELWSILASLSLVETALGRREAAKVLGTQAQEITQAIAETLRQTGLRDSFLHQPRVQALPH